MGVIVRAENISKAYQLGQINTGTFSDDLRRWWALKRGKQDPFLALGETNDRTSTSESKVVWSLKDVSFDIQHGESVGIIGRNGAGKSTLLKILSKITGPTEGVIRMKGKIASLLEVGTGFHPELSGKDNIYLNGAILGMRTSEIKRKFDEIVDFSGVERYIDTPVKRYSSGMYVRLAFAVAAHLESDILIVDEVLAVGDTEFQKKCRGKMSQLGKSTGKTILFVSHNMTAIKALCPKSIYLNMGSVNAIGETSAIINKYLISQAPKPGENGQIPLGTSLQGTGEARFKSLYTQNTKGENTKDFFFRDKIKLNIVIESFKDMDDVVIGVFLLNMYGEKIMMMNMDMQYYPHKMQQGIYEVSITLNETVMPGDYSFGLIMAHHHSGVDIDHIESFYSIQVSNEARDTHFSYPWATIHGYIQPKSDWQINKRQK